MLNVKRLALGLVVAGISLASASAVSAAPILTNGSFETPGYAGDFQTLAGGSGVISGWTVGPVDIDYIGTYWTASDGKASVDLNGFQAGRIGQTVTGLVAGTKYHVSFDMAGNPAGGPTLKTLDVEVGGIFQTGASFDPFAAGATLADMGWVTKGFDFTALNTSEFLEFISTTTDPSGNGTYPQAFGPALDNVKISQLTRGVVNVPEPFTLSVFGIGLAGAAALRRRRRQVKA